MQYQKSGSSQVNAIQYLREDNGHKVQDFIDSMEKIHGDKLPKYRYQPALNEYGLLVENQYGDEELHILKKGEWIVRETGKPYEVMSNAAFLQLYEVLDEPMITQGRCRKRTPVCEFIEILPDNREDLIVFCGDQKSILDYMKLGEYLVRNEFDQIYMYTPEQFRYIFERIEE